MSQLNSSCPSFLLIHSNNLTYPPLAQSTCLSICLIHKQGHHITNIHTHITTQLQYNYTFTIYVLGTGSYILLCDIEVPLFIVLIKTGILCTSGNRVCHQSIATVGHTWSIVVSRLVYGILESPSHLKCNSISLLCLGLLLFIYGCLNAFLPLRMYFNWCHPLSYTKSSCNQQNSCSLQNQIVETILLLLNVP